MPMFRSVHMMLSVSAIALCSTTAFGQEAESAAVEAAPAAAEQAAEGDQTIVVTARKREERL